MADWRGFRQRQRHEVHGAVISGASVSEVLLSVALLSEVLASSASGHDRWILSPRRRCLPRDGASAAHRRPRDPAPTICDRAGPRPTPFSLFTARITSPSRSSARAAGPFGTIPTATTLSSISVVNMPSHGRAGLLTRPNFRRSSRTGFSRSIGTFMLRCSFRRRVSRSSCSEPIPISSPAAEIRPVPPQLGCAGLVKMASSIRYSQ